MGLRRGLAIATAVLLVTGVVAAGRGGDEDQQVASSEAALVPEGGEVDPGWLHVPAGGDVTEVASGLPLEPSVPPEAPGLRRFETCDVLLGHLREEGLRRVTPYGLPGISDAVAMPTLARAEGGSSPAAAGQDSGATSPTGTNVQEAGVDEPDLVKHDGRRLVTLFDGTLRTIALGDGAANVAGAVDVGTGGLDHGILLAGDRVAVLAERWGWDEGGPAVDITVIDVSDVSRPRIVRRTEVDGQYVSAREAGGTVRVVVASPPGLEFVHPADGSARARDDALAANRRLIEGSTLADWLPTLRDGGVSTGLHAGACGAVHASRAPSGFTTTSVLTLDLAAATVIDTVSVVADGREVYASPASLYVATTPWPEVLDDGPDAPPGLRTDVHRFDIQDPRRTTYVASGTVPGSLLRPFFGMGGSNLAQWSLSEHAGHLRVASTVGAGPASESLVTVLRTEGDVLAPVGVVGGLGRGERIYAVRFAGDRGYVVTYRDIDPLYVLDLSDPAHPRALGELKIPGYSAYLHPVGPGLLFGVGQDDDDEDGLAEGTQVSLFDVSDPAAPRRVGHLSLGDRGTVSEAEGDHRAFTWSSDPARAILPLDDWHGGYRGAVVVSVDGGRLAEVGRITHRSADADGDGDCAHPVRRSRVIGGDLLTFSGAGVWANALGDLAPRWSLRYQPQPPASDCPARPAPEPPPTTTTTTTTLLPVPGR